MAQPSHAVCFPVQGAVFRFVRTKPEWFGPENCEDNHPPAEFMPEMKSLYKRVLKEEEKPWEVVEPLDPLKYDSDDMDELNSNRSKEENWFVFYTAIYNEVPVKSPQNENVNIPGLYGVCYVQKTFENQEGEATVMADITDEDMPLVMEEIADMQRVCFHKGQVCLDSVIMKGLMKNRVVTMTMIDDFLCAGYLQKYRNKYVPGSMTYDDLIRVFYSV